MTESLVGEAHLYSVHNDKTQFKLTGSDLSQFAFPAVSVHVYARGLSEKETNMLLLNLKKFGP